MHLFRRSDELLAALISTHEEYVRQGYRAQNEPFLRVADMSPDTLTVGDQRGSVSLVFCDYPSIQAFPEIRTLPGPVAEITGLHLKPNARSRSVIDFCQEIYAYGRFFAQNIVISTSPGNRIFYTKHGFVPWLEVRNHHEGVSDLVQLLVSRQPPRETFLSLISPTPGRWRLYERFHHLLRQDEQAFLRLKWRWLEKRKSWFLS